MIKFPEAGPSHFIAINGHRFHRTSAVVQSLETTAEAVSQLRRAQPDAKIQTTLFIAVTGALDPELREAADRLSITVQQLAESGNGRALNAQLSKAMEEGFTFFYRVDADDLVSEDRFLRQSNLMSNSGADICGGALVYHNVKTGDQSRVQPRENPGAFSYMLNAYMMHPTLALRLSAVKSAGLAYWDDRLEDKELALQARRAGLKLINDHAVYGVYNLDPSARSSREAARLNLDLNLAFLKQAGKPWLAPMAWGMYALRRTVNVNLLRRLRNRVLPVPRGASQSPAE